jgi:hypothetical protein
MPVNSRKNRSNRVIPAILDFIIVFRLLAVLISCNEANAQESYWVKSEIYSQVRRNTVGDNEFPFLEYLSAGARVQNVGTFDFSLKGFGDPLIKSSSFDLYSARIILDKLADSLTVTLGRQNMLGNYSFNVADGANIAFHPNFILNFEAYAGFVRFFELHEFKDWNFTGGGKILLNGIKNTYCAVEIRYEKIKDLQDWVEVGFLASRSFDTTLNPKIIAGGNFNITDKMISDASLDFSIDPVERLNMSLGAARYNFKKNDLDPAEDIFRIFSLGPLLEFRESVTFALTENVSLFETFSAEKYDYDYIESDLGYLGKIGANLLAIDKRLKADGYFYLGVSYGGKIYGGSAYGEFKITESLFAGLKAGVLRFDKVTGEKGNASSICADLGYRILNGLDVKLGGEYNSNDDFKRDLRGNLMVRYQFSK